MPYSREKTAEKLIDMRQKKAYRQAEIAEVLGISQSSYAYFELAKTDIPLGTIQSLAEFYQVPLECLVGTDD